MGQVPLSVRLLGAVVLLTGLLVGIVELLDHIVGTGDSRVIARHARGLMAGDASTEDDDSLLSLLPAIFSPLDPQAFANLGTLGKTLSSVMFTVLTATMLVVQLAVLRFTPLIVSRFSRSRVINTCVGILAATLAFAVTVNMSISDAYMPRVLVVGVVMAFTFTMMGLMPYYSYLLGFLDPTAVVSGLRKSCEDAIGGGKGLDSPSELISMLQSGAIDDRTLFRPLDVSGLPLTVPDHSAGAAGNGEKGKGNAAKKRGNANTGGAVPAAASSAPAPGQQQTARSSSLKPASGARPSSPPPLMGGSAARRRRQSLMKKRANNAAEKGNSSPAPPPLSASASPHHHTTKSSSSSSSSHDQGGGGRGASFSAEVARSQSLLVSSLDRLTDLGVKSLESKQKTITTAVVRSLLLFYRSHTARVHTLPAGFFVLPATARVSPDFVVLTDAATRRLEHRRTWVDWKVLRKLQVLFAQGLTDLEEVCFLIAAVTRDMGIVAAQWGRGYALGLVIVFFNTYIRAAINAAATSGNIRVIFNILFHYRSLAEYALLATMAEDADEASVAEAAAAAGAASGHAHPNLNPNPNHQSINHNHNHNHNHEGNHRAATGGGGTGGAHQPHQLLQPDRATGRRSSPSTSSAGGMSNSSIGSGMTLPSRQATFSTSSPFLQHRGASQRTLHTKRSMVSVRSNASAASSGVGGGRNRASLPMALETLASIPNEVAGHLAHYALECTERGLQAAVAVITFDMAHLALAAIEQGHLCPDRSCVSSEDASPARRCLFDPVFDHLESLPIPGALRAWLWLAAKCSVLLGPQNAYTADLVEAIVASYIHRREGKGDGSGVGGGGGGVGGDAAEQRAATEDGDTVVGVPSETDAAGGSGEFDAAAARQSAGSLLASLDEAVEDMINIATEESEQVDDRGTVLAYLDTVGKSALVGVSRDVRAAVAARFGARGGARGDNEPLVAAAPSMAVSLATLVAATLAEPIPASVRRKAHTYLAGMRSAHHRQTGRPLRDDGFSDSEPTDTGTGLAASTAAPTGGSGGGATTSVPIVTATAPGGSRIADAYASNNNNNNNNNNNSRRSGIPAQSMVSPVRIAHLHGGRRGARVDYDGDDGESPLGGVGVGGGGVPRSARRHLGDIRGGPDEDDDAATGAFAPGGDPRIDDDDEAAGVFNDGVDDADDDPLGQSRLERETAHLFANMPDEAGVDSVPLYPGYWGGRDVPGGSVMPEVQGGAFGLSGNNKNNITATNNSSMTGSGGPSPPGQQQKSSHVRVSKIIARSKLSVSRRGYVFFMAPLIAFGLIVLGWILDAGSDVNGPSVEDGGSANDAGRGSASPAAFFAAVLTRPPTILQTYATMSVLGHASVMILGLVLLASTFVLQIASTRLTPTVTALFYGDVIIHGTGVVFVAANVLLVWVGFASGGRYVSRTGSLVVVLLVSVTLAAVGRFMAYLTGFLEPERVIGGLVDRGVAALKEAVVQGAKVGGRNSAAPGGVGGDAKSDAARQKAIEAVAAAQSRLVVTIELLGDLGLAAVLRDDHLMASRVLLALRDLGLAYLRAKPRLSRSWFKLGGAVLDDLDFVSLSATALRSIARHRTWAEWKILRQMQLLFKVSFRTSETLCHMAAMHSRTIGTAAMVTGDHAVTDLATRFLNTYMGLSMTAPRREVSVQRAPSSAAGAPAGEISRAAAAAVFGSSSLGGLASGGATSADAVGAVFAEVGAGTAGTADGANRVSVAPHRHTFNTLSELLRLLTAFMLQSLTVAGPSSRFRERCGGGVASAAKGTASSSSFGSVSADGSADGSGAAPSVVGSGGSNSQGGGGSGSKKPTVNPPPLSEIEGSTELYAKLVVRLLRGAQAITVAAAGARAAGLVDTSVVIVHEFSGLVRSAFETGHPAHDALLRMFFGMVAQLSVPPSAAAGTSDDIEREMSSMFGVPPMGGAKASGEAGKGSAAASKAVGKEDHRPNDGDGDGGGDVEGGRVASPSLSETDLDKFIAEQVVEANFSSRGGGKSAKSKSKEDIASSSTPAGAAAAAVAAAAAAAPALSKANIQKLTRLGDAGDAVFGVMDDDLRSEFHGSDRSTDSGGENPAAGDNDRLDAGRGAGGKDEDKGIRSRSRRSIAALHSESREALVNAAFSIEAQRQHMVVLRGVACAQTKLAAMYLRQGYDVYAKTVHGSMVSMPVHVLKHAWREIVSARKRFWEIGDRGVNINWVDDADREYVPAFFSLFSGTFPRRFARMQLATGGPLDGGGKVVQGNNGAGGDGNGDDDGYGEGDGDGDGDDGPPSALATTAAAASWADDVPREGFMFTFPDATAYGGGGDGNDDNDDDDTGSASASGKQLEERLMRVAVARGRAQSHLPGMEEIKFPEAIEEEPMYGADYFHLRSRFRDHLRPFAVVFGGVVALVLVSIVAGESLVAGALPTVRELTSPSAASARVLTSSLVTTSTVLLALLGTLSLTVVFMTSSRFSPTMSALFLGDSGVLGTLCYATGVALACVWTLFSIREPSIRAGPAGSTESLDGHIPRGLLFVLVTAVCSVGCLVLPYCTYVLEFFDPRAIGWRATQRVRCVFDSLPNEPGAGTPSPTNNDSSSNNNSNNNGGGGGGRGPVSSGPGRGPRRVPSLQKSGSSSSNVGSLPPPLVLVQPPPLGHQSLQPMATSRQQSGNSGGEASLSVSPVPGAAPRRAQSAEQERMELEILAGDSPADQGSDRPLARDNSRHNVSQNNASMGSSERRTTAIFATGTTFASPAADTDARPPVEDKPSPTPAVLERQLRARAAMDELLSLGTSAASRNDKELLVHVVNGLVDVGVRYWRCKSAIAGLQQQHSAGVGAETGTQRRSEAAGKGSGPSPSVEEAREWAGWFRVTAPLRRSSPALAFLPKHELQWLDDTSLWFEYTLLSSLSKLFATLLSRFSAVTFIVSKAVFTLGGIAARSGDTAALGLIIRFGNTFIRMAMDAEAIRPGFNVLYHYRQLGLTILSVVGDPKTPPGLSNHLQMMLVNMAHYMRYYSVLFLSREMYFLSEIVAHDLAAIVQQAFLLNAKCHQSLLDVMLTVDDAAEDSGDDVSLRGIRRAQIKLATVYIVHNAMEFARQVQEDMAEEPSERIEGILFELTYVENEEFWEVNDRGDNVDFLAPDQKRALPIFLSLFPGYSSNSDQARHKTDIVHGGPDANASLSAALPIGVSQGQRQIGGVSGSGNGPAVTIQISTPADVPGSPTSAAKSPKSKRRGGRRHRRSGSAASTSNSSSTPSSPRGSEGSDVANLLGAIGDGVAGDTGDNGGGGAAGGSGGRKRATTLDSSGNGSQRRRSLQAPQPSHGRRKNRTPHDYVPTLEDLLARSEGGSELGSDAGSDIGSDVAGGSERASSRGASSQIPAPVYLPRRLSSQDGDDDDNRHGEIVGAGAGAGAGADRARRLTSSGGEAATSHSRSGSPNFAIADAQSPMLRAIREESLEERPDAVAPAAGASAAPSLPALPSLPAPPVLVAQRHNSQASLPTRTSSAFRPVVPKPNLPPPPVPPPTATATATSAATPTPSKAAPIVTSTSSGSGLGMSIVISGSSDNIAAQKGGSGLCPAAIASASAAAAASAAGSPAREHSRASSTHSTVMALASRARQGSIADPVHSRDRLFDRAEASEYILPVETVGGRESVSLSKSMLERQRMGGRSDDSPQRKGSVLVPRSTRADTSSPTRQSSSSAGGTGMSIAVIPPLVTGNGGDAHAGSSGGGSSNNSSSNDVKARGGGNAESGPFVLEGENGEPLRSKEKGNVDDTGNMSDPEPLLARRRSAVALTSLSKGPGSARSTAGSVSSAVSRDSRSLTSAPPKSSHAGGDGTASGGAQLYSGRMLSLRSMLRSSMWLLVLPVVPLLLFVLTLVIDVEGTGAMTWSQVGASLLPTDPAKGNGTLVSIAEVMTMQLRIVMLISLVSVQISSERFTPLITSIFFGHKVIRGALCFFALTVCYVLAVKYFTTPLFLPTFSVTLAVVMAALCYSSIVPYFVFVLNFLQPETIIDHIVFKMVRDAVGGGADVQAVGPESGSNAPARGSADAAAGSPESAPPAQDLTAAELLARERRLTIGMERLSDLALKALRFSDRIVAAKACHAFGEFVMIYGASKHRLPAAWFEFPPSRQHSSDFLNLSASELERIAKRRTWVEYKVLKLFQVLYSAALASGREVCYIVAINTRKVGLDAVRRWDLALLDTTIRFFNTYLRSAINARDVRVLYNVLHQLQLFACDVVMHVPRTETARGGERGETELPRRVAEERYKDLQHRVLQITLYLCYYSNICLERGGLDFVSQIIAYDIGMICETAYLAGARCHRGVLGMFLTLDDNARSKSDFVTCRAIRRAQIKLATLYLATGHVEGADAIAQDMDEEPRRTLLQLWRELLRCDKKEFWEIVDRGRNFDYIPPGQKARLKEFFGRFPSLDGFDERAFDDDDDEGRGGGGGGGANEDGSDWSSSTDTDNEDVVSIGSGVGSASGMGVDYERERDRDRRNSLDSPLEAGDLRLSPSPTGMLILGADQGNSNVNNVNNVNINDGKQQQPPPSLVPVSGVSSSSHAGVNHARRAGSPLGRHGSKGRLPRKNSGGVPGGPASSGPGPVGNGTGDLIALGDLRRLLSVASMKELPLAGIGLPRPQWGPAEPDSPLFREPAHSGVSFGIAGITAPPPETHGAAYGSYPVERRRSPAMRALAKALPFLYVPLLFLAITVVALVCQNLMDNEGDTVGTETPNGGLATTFANWFRSVAQTTHSTPLAFTASTSLPLMISTCAVLVVSVSTIVVQIGATRFTPLITGIFFRDRVIIGYFSFFATTEIYVLLSTHMLDSSAHPTLTVLVGLVLAITGIVLLFPYFDYLIGFLDPRLIVERIANVGMAAIEQVELAAVEGEATPALHAPREEPRHNIRRGSSALALGVGLNDSGNKAAKGPPVDDSLPPPPSRPRHRPGVTVAPIPDLQHQLSDAIERLSDLGLKAIQWRDLSVANHAVGGLVAVGLRHARMISDLRRVSSSNDPTGAHGPLTPPAAWFEPPLEWQLLSPDFLTLSSDSVGDLGRRGTWCEWKVLRGVQGLFIEAMGRMPGVCATIAAGVRAVGESSVRGGRVHVTELAVKFFNTLLRLSATKSGVGIADAVLYEYTNLALVVLRYGDGPLAHRIAKHLSHYGLLFLTRRIRFAPTAAASDLARLAASAAHTANDSADDLFRVWNSFCERVLAYPRSSANERSRVRAVQIVYYAGSHQRGQQTIILSSLRGSHHSGGNHHNQAGRSASPSGAANGAANGAKGDSSVERAFSIVLGTQRAEFHEQCTRVDNIFYPGTRGRARVEKLRELVQAAAQHHQHHQHQRNGQQKNTGDQGKEKGAAVSAPKVVTVDDEEDLEI